MPKHRSYTVEFIAEAMHNGTSHWQALCRFLDDGRVEIDTKAVERARSAPSP